MKIPSIFPHRHAGLALPLTPLLSLAFLLLLYPAWTSRFAPAELSLPTRLASAAVAKGAPPDFRAPESDFDPIAVHVRRQGAALTWTIQDAPVASLAELRQRLANIARIKHDAPLLIDPAPDVPLGDVIALFDLARLSGLTKIQFAVSDRAAH